MSNYFLDKFKDYILILLPVLLIFFRGIADVTLVLICLVFLYRSYKINDWEWIKQKWFIFSLFFWFYLILINTPLSIDFSNSLFYSFAFIRWPLFAMALSIWLLQGYKSKKNFLISLFFTLGFIIFDIWWQYIFEYDKT